MHGGHATVSSEPYRRVFNRDSPSKLVTGGSVRQSLSWRLCLFTGKELATQEKCV